MARSHEDKVEIIFTFGASNENYHEAERRFNVAHPDRPVTRKYIRSLVSKFRETGSIKDAPRSGRPSLDEDKQFEIVAQFVEDPQTSTRSVANICNVSQMSVVRLLKKNKFHPYKIQLVHELNEDDPDRRLQFCEEIEGLIRAHPLFVHNIVFSDECCFFVNGAVNKHNCRYWDSENPHIFRESNTQYPEKLNVWAGILGNHILGPFFINGNLNGEMYLQMLLESIFPAITHVIMENADEFDADIVHFQQDGAPPHFHRDVRHFLSTQLRGQWIGRRGLIEWPARSPDLTPMDFFLWGHIKSIIYKTPVENIEDLRNRIVEACNNIPLQTFQNVREEFTLRLSHCQIVGGLQFEHLI
jgi:transposase